MEQVLASWRFARDKFEIETDGYDWRNDNQADYDEWMRTHRLDNMDLDTFKALLVAGDIELVEKRVFDFVAGNMYLGEDRLENGSWGSYAMPFSKASLEKALLLNCRFCRYRHEDFVVLNDGEPVSFVPCCSEAFGLPNDFGRIESFNDNGRPGRAVGCSSFEWD